MTYYTKLNLSCFSEKINPKLATVLAKVFKTQTKDLQNINIWMAHAMTKTVTGRATSQNA